MIQPPSANDANNQQKRQRPRFDISNLTVSDVEQLESIHRKLFQTPVNLTPSQQQQLNAVKLVENEISNGKFSFRSCLIIFLNVC
jgi:hypothetical protein